MNVILIFALVFLPIAWFIYQMLRFTAKTVGDESPLQIPVTYQITSIHYYSRLSFLLPIVFALLLLTLLIMGVWLIGQATAIGHWLVVGSMIGTSLYGLYMLALLFQLEDQYWEITKNREITLNPADNSIKIQHGIQIDTITPDSIRLIEQHTTNFDTPKIFRGYSYYRFILKNDRRVYLNNNSSYLYFTIETYFKGVPRTSIDHKIPWIK